MKKILLSISVIGVVAVAAIGATGAFFSDTETSTGNTFTAGAIDLQVDSHATYNGQPVASSTWQLKDLNPTSDKFFDFGDIKPGDVGENTISLHVINNDAYVCAAVSNLTNYENGQSEPEAAVDLTTGVNEGELQSTMVWKVWKDDGEGGGVAGDNIQNGTEPTLASGHPANGVMALYDSTTGPLAAASTTYLGVSWTLPAASGNETQTDSMTGDISFNVVQSRNNGGFVCGAREQGPTNTTVVVGANDLETVLANSATSEKWYFYDDSLDVLNNSLGGFVVGPVTPPLGTGSAVANPLASASGRTLLTNGGFGGTLLSNISALSYSYYQPSGAWSANEAPFVRFNVDFAGSPSYQKSLVYVPIANGPVTQNSWQTANMATAGALWVYSGAFWPAGVSELGTTPGATAKTWASILADYPSVRMHPLFPQIGMRVGEPGPIGLTANLDKFSITISGNTQTFNFEN